MCTYCGCREFPLIGRLCAEHESIDEAAARLREAVAGHGGDPLEALDALLALLLPHTALEEGGLFAALRDGDGFAAEIDRLCAEHVDIHGVLGAVDRSAPDWPAVLAALERLYRHIDHEEHGLFPAAVVELSIDVWERLTPAAATSTASR